MLNKYLLIVSALVAVLAYFVLYEKTETGPTEQNSPIVSVEIPNEFSELAQIGKVNYQNNCADCHGKMQLGNKVLHHHLFIKFTNPVIMVTKAFKLQSLWEFVRIIGSLEICLQSKIYLDLT